MRQAMEQIHLTTDGRGLHEITGRVRAWAEDQGVRTGLLTLFVHHTSASLVIQENADPAVMDDLDRFFCQLVPEDRRYRHGQEGADDMPAHIKCALTATQLSIPVRAGRLDLGTWQGIFLYEHRDRPRPRRITLHLLGE